MSDKLTEKIRYELVTDEVSISNNKLLLITGALNYFIDTKKLPKKKNIVRLNLVKYLEKKLDDCGIMENKEKDEELRDLKQEFFITILKLTQEQISLLIESLDHRQSNEGRGSKKYLEIKNNFENILQEWLK